MIELFPEGFEELDHDDGVELVAYTDARGEERLWQAFGHVSTAGLDEGWEDRWRLFHRPVEVAGLWIGPPWEEPPPGARAVVVDPGRAFGTGSHATTRLVLRLLERIERGSLVDAGCGSGVVAIGAVKLGFGPVVALDIDESAIAATRRNAAVNDVQLEVRRGDATEAIEASDVCVANVTLDVVERLGQHVRCSVLITSGYLLSDEPHLPRFERVERIGEDGWAADWFRRGAE